MKDFPSYRLGYIQSYFDSTGKMSESMAFEFVRFSLEKEEMIDSTIFKYIEKTFPSVIEYLGIILDY